MTRGVMTSPTRRQRRSLQIAGDIANTTSLTYFPLQRQMEVWTHQLPYLCQVRLSPTSVSPNPFPV